MDNGFVGRRKNNCYGRVRSMSQEAWLDTDIVRWGYLKKPF